MKLSVEDLPEKERSVFLTIQQLPQADKKILWKLIRCSNKDHICIVKRLTPSVKRLTAKELVTVNPSYKNVSGTSLFVLRKAPFLMKKLQVIGQKD